MGAWRWGHVDICGRGTYPMQGLRMIRPTGSTWQIPSAGTTARVFATAVFFLMASNSLPQTAIPTEAPGDKAATQRTPVGSSSGGFGGRVHVSGRVIDDKGALLNGVTVLLQESRFGPSGAGLFSELRRRETVNGRFSFSCVTCVGLTMVFMKPGFYEETLQYSTAKNGPEEPSVTSGNVEVVLQARGRLGGLQRTDGAVKAYSSERACVVAFTAKGVGREELVLLVGTTPRIADVRTGLDTGNVLTDRFFYLAPSAGPTSEVRSTSFVQTDGRIDRTRSVPVDLSLWASNEGDGFVVVDLKPQLAERYDLGLRVMREAPDSGYQPRMSIRDDRPYTFFYCRVGSLYGKGAVAKPTFSDLRRADVPQTGVHVYLSVDGTRVTTGEP